MKPTIVVKGIVDRLFVEKGVAFLSYYDHKEGTYANYPIEGVLGKYIINIYQEAYRLGRLDAQRAIRQAIGTQL